MTHGPSLVLRQVAAAAEPGGGYVMMRRLRHRSWYQTLNIRWGPELLRQLPAHTVADMRRCAAAMLTQEAHLAEAARAIGAHARPTIRSYNTHGSPAAAVRARVDGGRVCLARGALSSPAAAAG